MAAALDDLKFSRSLFMQENGSPISFHLRPGFERKLIKPVIERGGGTVSCWPRSGAIKLCSDSDRAGAGEGEGEVSWQYVIHCAKANRLLEMASYRRSTSPGEDDLAPARVITTSRSQMRGRQKYSAADDKKIVSYLVKEQRYSEVKGKKVWQDMQLLEVTLKVTQHSMESMRSRYLKVILPNIKSYNLPLYWLSLLTGNADDAQPTDELNRETSPKHKQSPAGESKSPHTIALSSPKSTLGRGSVSSDLDSASEDDFDTMLLTTAEDGICEGRASRVTLGSTRKKHEVDSEVSINTVSKSLRNRQSVNKTSPRKRQNLDTQRDKDSVNKTSPRRRQNVDTERDKNSVNKTSPRKRQNVDTERDKDSVNKTSPRRRQNVDTERDKDSVNETSPRRRQNVDTEKDKDSVNETSPRKRQNVDTERDKNSVNKTSPRRRQNVDTERDKNSVNKTSPRRRQNVDTEKDKDSVNETSPRRRQNVDTEKDKDSVNETSPRKRQNVDTERDKNSVNKTSSRRRQNVDTEKDKDSVNETSPRKRQNVETERDKDRVRRVSQRKRGDVDTEMERSSGTASPDSYDRRLLMSGARMMEQLDQAFPSSPNKQARASTRRRSCTKPDLFSQDKESEPEPTGGTKQKRGRDMQETVKTAGIKSLVNFLMKDSEPTPQETSDSEAESEREENYAGVDEIQTVAAEFGLTADEMKYVLYINSGRQTDALHWIKFGCDTQGYPAWSESDDRTLQGTDHTSLAALQFKHSSQRILSRSLFLEGTTPGGQFT